MNDQVRLFSSLSAMSTVIRELESIPDLDDEEQRVLQKLRRESLALRKKLGVEVKGADPAD